MCFPFGWSKKRQRERESQVTDSQQNTIRLLKQVKLFRFFVLTRSLKWWIENMCHRKNPRQRFSVSVRSRNLRSVEHCHSDSPIPSPENRNFGPGTFFRNQPHNCRRSNFSAEIKLHFFQFSNFVFRDCSLRTLEASNWTQIFHHSFALSLSERPRKLPRRQWLTFVTFGTAATIL